MSHAGYAYFLLGSSLVIPTMAIRADLAFSNMISRSNRIVRPASIANTEALTETITSMVRGPTAGRSNRMSCCGFDRLTTTAPSFTKSPPRLIALVCTFNRLDGHDHTIFDHDTLADIETPDFMRHFPSVADILPLFLRRGREVNVPSSARIPFKPKGRLTDGNPFPLQLLRQLAQNVIVFPERQRVANAKVRKSGRRVVNTWVFLIPPTSRPGELRLP